MRKEVPTQVNKGCSNVIGCMFIMPLVAAVGTFVLLSLPPSTDAPPPAPSQVDTPAPSDAAGGSTSPGTQGRLDYNGGPVLVATSEDVASQIANDIAANNTAALSQLEKNGDAYIVDDDTPVIVVKSDSYLTGASVYHVQIEGGEHNGEDGWVPGDYVIK